MENTRRLAEGDFDALMEDAGENEVTILNKSFNRMAAKLQRLMEKVEEDTRTQEQLELRLLQEQINPHFLYNTLEIIVWLAESGDKEQVIQVVQSLSRFFPGGPQQRPRSGVPSGGAVLHPKLSLYSESALCRYPEL